LAAETAPKSTQSVASATVLLMASAVLSGLLALVRIGYVNDLFGAGVEQDAYRAAFRLPDLIAYFLAGSAASISLITVLNRYRVAEDDEGGDQVLSVILTTMFVVLLIGVLLGEIFAPYYVWFAFKGFRSDPVRAALCTSLTRILLPAQLLFFIGSMFSARLQVRKIFIYQALSMPIYTAGIVLGAVFLHRRYGIYSLAIGAVCGVLFGSAMLNALGAFRTGFRYRPQVSFSHPVFREWLKLALPLMIGVSLVTFDIYFLSYFASTQNGGITLIGNAKELFNAPFNVIGPAAGAASLPFFASLFQQRRAFDFSASVGRSVSRLLAVGLLVSAWMMALAPWLIDIFRRGKYNRADAAETTKLFTVLAITLGIWAIQGIYARAFYAASDTKTPAITGSLITVASIPVYWLLFHLHGLTGLAIASDIGITIQTAALAILLHKKRLVSLLHLEFAEIGRALLAAIVACVTALSLARALPPIPSYKGDVLTIAAGTIAWAIAACVILKMTGSNLPAQILRRKPKPLTTNH
jgi:putative peptidoglycan lipid II flippase